MKLPSFFKRSQTQTPPTSTETTQTLTREDRIKQTRDFQNVKKEELKSIIKYDENLLENTKLIKQLFNGGINDISGRFIAYKNAQYIYVSYTDNTDNKKHDLYFYWPEKLPENQVFNVNNLSPDFFEEFINVLYQIKSTNTGGTRRKNNKKSRKSRKAKQSKKTRKGKTRNNRRKTYRRRRH